MAKSPKEPAKVDPIFKAYCKMKDVRIEYEAAWAVYEDTRDVAMRREREMDRACQLDVIASALTELTDAEHVAETADEVCDAASRAIAAFKAWDARITVAYKRLQVVEKKWQDAMALHDRLHAEEDTRTTAPSKTVN